MDGKNGQNNGGGIKSDNIFSCSMIFYIRTCKDTSLFFKFTLFYEKYKYWKSIHTIVN
jgi:hypothetical protein